MEEKAPNREELLQVAASILGGMCSNPDADYKWPRLAREAVDGARALIEAVDEQTGHTR